VAPLGQLAMSPGFIPDLLSYIVFSAFQGYNISRLDKPYRLISGSFCEVCLPLLRRAEAVAKSLRLGLMHEQPALG
jgi:hypothetical protein